MYFMVEGKTISHFPLALNAALKSDVGVIEAYPLTKKCHELSTYLLQTHSNYRYCTFSAPYMF